FLYLTLFTFFEERAYAASISLCNKLSICTERDYNHIMVSLFLGNICVNVRKGVELCKTPAS
ncbi:hypothetical protein ACVTKO_004419, partial [Shigella flexneri]